MNRTLSELAQLVRGTIVLPHVVDGSSERIDPNNILIDGTATIRNAQHGQLTFAKGELAWKFCRTTKASAVVVSEIARSERLPCIVVADPEAAFAELTKLFRPAVQRSSVGISPRANVSPLARIGDNVSIYPNAYVGDHVVIGNNTTIMPGVCIMERCQIGDNVTLFPNVTLYENTIVGDRCIVHAGVVLGAYGFGYRTENGRHQLSSQLGNVEIGEEVEIGANTTIDRGTYDSTRIGSGTKIDNQVMIGHNCHIGKHNLLCSQVGIAGSCTTGDYVIMAGQVGIGDHIDIGEHVILGAKAGVMHSIEPKQHYLGIPATPIREQMQIMASTQKLPELRKQIGRLTKVVEEMTHNEVADENQATPTSNNRKAA